jgi:vacuolar-type H+-ATPase subunit F/Vma7
MARQEVLVVMGKEVKPGFLLAGVHVEEAKDGKEAEKIVLDAIESGKYGIIILEEEFLEDFDPRNKAKILESVVPLVVPISVTLSSTISVEEYLEMVVRRAIGYHIKVRA